MSSSGASGAGSADLVQDGVLVGGVVGGQVRKRGEHGIPLGADHGLLVAQRSAACGQCGELLALFGRGRSATPAAGSILLGLKLLELGADRAPAPIELEHLIDRAGQLRAPTRE